MRHILAAAMMMLAGGAMAQEAPAQWMLWDDPAYVSLNWGTPETDHVEVLFGCEPGVPEIDFVYFADMPEARNGRDVNVWLSNGALDYLVPAIGERMAMDDSFALSGVVVVDPVLEKILRSDQLTVRVEGEPDTASYDLRGAQALFDTLLATCREQA
ncbi:MAG TPA: hypothetical protein VLZ53_07700 [Devosia sp.]|nr:hypothetical protein [Devosia sp.]